jgi:threonyl-tRNA synthetase
MKKRGVDMPQIVLQNGDAVQYPAGTTFMDIAKRLSQRLDKESTAALFNGRPRGLTETVDVDGVLRFVDFSAEEGKTVYRHSSAHIMAQAVLRLWPETKLAIGPAIDRGFYYDFDTEHIFTPEDFSTIEKEMNRIIKENHPILRQELSREDALQLFRDMDEPYKVDLIENLPDDAVISIYRQGEFLDLCAGPHLPSTGRAKCIKCMSVAGAYWRGDEHNKMLQRIYATAFPSREEMDAYLHRIEEAKRRDHRKLGRELDLFVFLDEGPGFPFFLPKGMVLRNQLETFWREMHAQAGYEEIRTPILLDIDLWRQSGHWDFYADNMYTTAIDEELFALKPMNCPGSMLVYKQRLHSYKELPLRWAEMGLVHRHELSGALHGLMRVRAFTQDDAHIFMLPEQIKEELKGVLDLVDQIYNPFGFRYHVELSTRPEKSMGADELWETATQALRDALEEKSRTYKINPGDGAFYGPKIDFHLQDSLDRTWQCGTIQLDFQMPEKFGLTYVGEDGGKHRPVMIHRTIFGSVERFIGILTEHYVGAFPAWLAPVQARVLPITDKHALAASALKERLKAAGLRAEVDLRSEKIGFKIREGQLQKIPYLLIIGDKEAEQGLVSVRHRKDGDLGAQLETAFIAGIQEEVRRRR